MTHETVVVLEHELIRVEALPSKRVLFVRRSSVRGESTGDVFAAYQAALAKGAPYAGWSMVLDMRAAPGRNDDDFESSVKGLRDASDRLFPRIVLLVASPVGELQIRRMAREQSRSALVAYDDAEALRLCAAR